MNVRSKTKRCKIKKGSFLVEILLGTLILSSTLVIFLAILGPAYTQEFSRRDKIIAANLAQEGVEIIRFFRDKNLVASQTAFQGFSSGGKCIDYKSTSIGIGSFSLCTLFKDSNGFYTTIGTGIPVSTKFSRFVNLDSNCVPTNDDKGCIVTSKVEWKNASGTMQNVTVTDTLYPWGNVD